MIPKHPPGPPMTRGNMRELIVADGSKGPASDNQTVCGSEGDT